MKSAKELLKQAQMNHVVCEDSWYSCPLAEGGCSDDAVSEKCNCGASRINETLEQLGAQVEQVLQLLVQIQESAYVDDFGLTLYTVDADQLGRAIEMLKGSKGARCCE